MVKGEDAGPAEWVEVGRKEMVLGARLTLGSLSRAERGLFACAGGAMRDCERGELTP